MRVLRILSCLHAICELSVNIQRLACSVMNCTASIYAQHCSRLALAQTAGCWPHTIRGHTAAAHAYTFVCAVSALHAVQLHHNCRQQHSMRIISVLGCHFVCHVQSMVKCVCGLLLLWSGHAAALCICCRRCAWCRAGVSAEGLRTRASA